MSGSQGAHSRRNANKLILDHARVRAAPGQARSSDQNPVAQVTPVRPLRPGALRLLQPGRDSRPGSSLQGASKTFHLPHRQPDRTAPGRPSRSAGETSTSKPRRSAAGQRRRPDQWHPGNQGTGESVPMAADVAEALGRLAKRKDFTGPSDFVFVSWRGQHRGQHLDGSAPGVASRQPRQEAKLRPLRFHDLRHTFCQRDDQPCLPGPTSPGSATPTRRPPPATSTTNAARTSPAHLQRLRSHGRTPAPRPPRDRVAAERPGAPRRTVRVGSVETAATTKPSPASKHG